MGKSILAKMIRKSISGSRTGDVPVQKTTCGTDFGLGGQSQFSIAIPDPPPMNRSTLSPVFVYFLCLLGSWAVSVQATAQAEPVGSATAESTSIAADSLLLDQYSNAYAAYSLRKLRSDYTGPAIRVRRSSDDAKQDIGFDDSGMLDISALESFVGSADGYVTVWYSQVDGEPDLTQGTNGNQPRIAQGGIVETNSDGKPTIRLTGQGSLSLDGSFASTIPMADHLLSVVGDMVNPSGARYTLIEFNNGYTIENWDSSAPGATRAYNTAAGTMWAQFEDLPGFWGLNFAESTAKAFSNNSVVESASITDSGSMSSMTITNGLISEVAILPGQSTEDDVVDVYVNLNTDWELGPQGFHRDALLPQASQWQVDLYDWLKSIDESDVTLPSGTPQYDNSYSTEDELADLWMRVRDLSASSVTRRPPGWYVLDNGSGKGFEATGKVRANHEPKGPGGYGGNPARSWQNGPAMWYDLDIPLSGGGQGNPWYQNPAMGRRAMTVSTVDLMMHADNMKGNATGWFDMVGKGFLAMTDAYRRAGDVMPVYAQDAYEKGLEEILDHLIARGPRGANTNMDMWALRGAAELWVATSNSTIKQKCVQLVKRALFGFTDGELETKHELFARSGDGGVFHPAGFIMEGGQPDPFYGGDSVNRLAGALARVTDRETGNVPAEWQFLEEVVRRLQEWLEYQQFYEPAKIGAGALDQAGKFPMSGTGYAGRTSLYAPKSQGDVLYRAMTVGNRFDELSYRAWVPDVPEMGNEISSVLSTMDTRMASRYTNPEKTPPKVWGGWSPWAKRSPYLPPEGWYSGLKALQQNDSKDFKHPEPSQDNTTFNKTFGGPPSGKAYWSYKDTDANGGEWGFFVEAQARQGIYGGWYGGKIETFWTESTGVVLINRHGKTGCNRSGVDDYSGNEDSMCWFNLDEKAGHHVWGRDENGKGFSTLFIRGKNLTRTSTFNTDGSPPTVTVNNVFNDPNQTKNATLRGEQNDTVIQGSLEVKNKFEAQSNGLKVTHTVTSDQSDQVTELWASLPVFLRDYNPHKGGDELQNGMQDTRIEYWDDSQWVELPFDTDNDDVPEMVSTDALRLMRDFQSFGGKGYVYVDLSSTENVRRSKHKYYDPYQTNTGVRTVHIDLHGNSGTVKTLPAEKSVSYTVQATDPTSEEAFTSQVIQLQRGWNITSTFVSPTAPAMDSVFAGLQSEITVVKNEAGERYRPGGNTNEIGQWNSEEAYLVHAKSNTELTVQGDSLEPTAIGLEQGWNLVPYFPPSPLSTQEAVSSIAEELVLVKDGAGRAYIPEKNIDALDKMQPGKGYRIYVRQSTALDYPDDSN